jgi:hypothetical protein
MLQSPMQGGEGLPQQKVRRSGNRASRANNLDIDSAELGQFRELIDLKKMWSSANKIWAGSLAVVLALVFGFFSGNMYSKNAIVNDCSFTNGFRVNSQAFTCQRRI